MTTQEKGGNEIGHTIEFERYHLNEDPHCWITIMDTIAVLTASHVRLLMIPSYSPIKKLQTPQV